MQVEKSKSREAVGQAEMTRIFKAKEAQEPPEEKVRPGPRGETHTARNIAVQKIWAADWTQRSDLPGKDRGAMGSMGLKEWGFEKGGRLKTHLYRLGKGKKKTQKGFFPPKSTLSSSLSVRATTVGHIMKPLRLLFQK